MLATNVAETSLTVPGLNTLSTPVQRVSAATAIAPKCSVCRLSRFPRRLPISVKAAGRVSEGICIRLYSEDDFLSRPEFTDPEILRTNLASVILQMTALGLGDIAAFPFVEAPDKRNIQDGVRLLENWARSPRMNRPAPIN
ncbi:hypothetical protein ACVXHB_26500 [Escherichia coli]